MARAVQRGDALSARRLKVLHVISSLGVAGAETLLARILMSPSTFDHEVISLAAPDWYSAALAEHGVRVHYLNMTNGPAGLRGLWHLRRLVATSDADVIQGWMYRSNLLAGLFARRPEIPVVWGIHCSSLEPLGLGARLWVYASGLVAGRLPAYIVNCSSRSAELHARLGFQRSAGRVIHNGYDPARFFPSQSERDRLRGELGISAGTFLVGSIARWHPQKDIPNLLSAVRLAAARGVPIHCLLIGLDLVPGNAALAELIRSEGVEQLVTPLGPRRDIDDVARALDLHILASGGGEAFPNAVAETMLSGTPSVVTDVGDCALMVGETGWTVPPRDPAGLAAAIGQAHAIWRDGPTKWADRGADARQRIVANFSIDRMIDAYEDVWRSAASTAKRSFSR